jgi:SPOR domain
MKILYLICLLTLFSACLWAQDTVPTERIERIVDKINKLEPGKGTVVIIQDDKISDKIGRPGKNELTASSQCGERRYVEMMGWRIQVFSGNNQRVAKNEAFRKETDVKTTFPELSTYVKYNAPFWRLRVGDFQTYQDAQGMITQLRHTFPSFGREMSIVKEKIQVIVQ